MELVAHDLRTQVRVVRGLGGVVGHGLCGVREAELGFKNRCPLLGIVCRSFARNLVHPTLKTFHTGLVASSIAVSAAAHHGGKADCSEKNH